MWVSRTNKIRITKKKPSVRYRTLVISGLLAWCGIFGIFFVGSKVWVALQQYAPDDTLIVTNNQLCIDKTIAESYIQPTELLDTGPVVKIDRLAPDLSHTSVPSACIQASDVQVEIYMYHYVRPSRWDAQWSVIWNNSISPETARDHYAHLASLRDQNKIHLTTMSHIQKYQDANCFPHPRVIVLTFDDGRWDNYEYLLPLAREFDIPANLAIIADRISRDVSDRIDAFMTYSEILSMIESGYFEISGHSLTHTDLKNMNPDQQRQEICTSTRSLEDIFWVQINTFVYPMWRYNSISIEAANNCGLSYGLTTRDWTNTSNDLNTDPFQLYRKRVTKWSTGAELYGE